MKNKTNAPAANVTATPGIPAPVRGTPEWYRAEIAKLDAAASRYEQDAGILLEAMAERGVVSSELVTDNHGKRIEKPAPNPAGRLWKEATSTAKKLRGEIKRLEGELKKLESAKQQAANPMNEIFERLQKARPEVQPA